MTDIRQIILLSIAISVPVILFRLSRHRALLAWVCLTLFVQILDTSILTNLPTGRIVGLMYLPKAVSTLRDWIRYKPLEAWLINYGYLLILGVAFGFLWPWPDSTMLRPFSLTASGRTLIYSARLLSDFSLAIFVANQLHRPGEIRVIARWMVWGATITAAVGLLYLATGFDLAYAINGFEDITLTAERAHGLSAEPRGMGLACAYGVMILLVGQEKLFRFWQVMMVINLIGLFGTFSTSALALLVTGVVAGWILFSNRTRWAIIFLIVTATLVIMSTSILFPNQFETATRIIGARVDPGMKLEGIPPGTFGEEIAYRLDAFDASALLFLLDHPFYALIGTGPGLISLPASLYVPPGLYSAIWTSDVGINSPPFHGILLEICNSGVPGLALWLFQVISCWSSLRLLANPIHLKVKAYDWDLGCAIFLTGAVFYLVQVSISPVWSVMLGIGWAAVRAGSGYHPARYALQEKGGPARHFDRPLDIKQNWP